MQTRCHVSASLRVRSSNSPGVFLFECERAEELHVNLYSRVQRVYQERASERAERNGGLNGFSSPPAAAAAAAVAVPSRPAALPAGGMQATRLGALHLLSNPAAFQQNYSAQPSPSRFPAAATAAATAFPNFPAAANQVRLRQHPSVEGDEEPDHIRLSSIIPHIAGTPNSRALTNGASASNAQNFTAPERMLILLVDVLWF